MDNLPDDLISELIREQKKTNDLLLKISNHVNEILTLKNSKTEIIDIESSEKIFDPEFLIKFNKTTQKVILKIGKYFAEGNKTLSLDDAKNLLNLSYPQTSAYLNELEQNNVISYRRGDKTKNENPLKKYYFLSL